MCSVSFLIAVGLSHNDASKEIEPLDQESPNGTTCEPAECNIVPIAIDGPHPRVHDDQTIDVLGMVDGVG